MILHELELLIEHFNQAFNLYLENDLKASSDVLALVLSSKHSTILPKLTLFAIVLRLELGFKMNQLFMIPTWMSQLSEFQEWLECMYKAKHKMYCLYEESSITPLEPSMTCSEDDWDNSPKVIISIMDHYRVRLSLCQGNLEKSLSFFNSQTPSEEFHQLSFQLLYAYSLLKMNAYEESAQELIKMEQALYHHKLDHLFLNNAACLHLNWNRPISTRILLLKCLRFLNTMKIPVFELKFIAHNLIRTFER